MILYTSNIKQKNQYEGNQPKKILKRLKTELKSNTSSVEIDLGGGNHAYLGLAKSNEDYATIPNSNVIYLNAN